MLRALHALKKWNFFDDDAGAKKCRGSFDQHDVKKEKDDTAA